MGHGKQTGAWDQLKGRVKRAAGEITENEDLKEAGSRDKVKGDVKNIVGDIQELGHKAAKKVEKAAESVEERASKHD